MPIGVYKKSEAHKKKISEAKKGKRCSIRTEFKKGHKQGKGKDNPSWKGGRTIDPKGYVLIKKLDHPFCNNQGYVFEHRLVMEKKLGRYLNIWEVIHHKDKDVQNNNIDNLQLFSNNSEHISFHEKEEKKCH